MNDNNNPRSPEEEIRRIIEKYGSMEVSEEWAQTEEPVAPADTDTAAAFADDEPSALSSAEEFPLVMPVEEPVASYLPVTLGLRAMNSANTPLTAFSTEVEPPKFREPLRLAAGEEGSVEGSSEGADDVCAEGSVEGEG